MLHQIGHALGLADTSGGQAQMVPLLDTSALSVMSPNGTPSTTLGLFDYQAIQHLYGRGGFVTPHGGGLQDFVVDALALTTQQIWGADASEIWGSNLADQIHAGAGDDQLFGGFGNDRLVGGAGRDLIV